MNIAQEHDHQLADFTQRLGDFRAQRQHLPALSITDHWNNTELYQKYLSMNIAIQGLCKCIYLLNEKKTQHLIEQSEPDENINL